jgi:hypothetical protein
MPRWTLSEAAQHTRGRDGEKLSPVTLRVAIQRGRLRAVKEGKTWYVTDSQLSAYLRDRPRWWKPQARAAR